MRDLQNLLDREALRICMIQIVTATLSQLSLMQIHLAYSEREYSQAEWILRLECGFIDA